MIKKITQNLPYTTHLEDHLKGLIPDLYDFRILSMSLDARNAPRGRAPHHLYEIEYRTSENDSFTHYEELTSLPNDKKNNNPPIIVGSGPGGLFCALRLAERGVPSILFERGDATRQRMLSISRYWRQGVLDPDSNVCFGEGGAGLFSDGKLLTRIKSPHVAYVMNRMVRFGAPAEVEYRKDPHVGSNKIRQVIIKLTDYLKTHGVQIHYRSRVERLLYAPETSGTPGEMKKVIGVELSDGRRFYSDHVVLAVGHSASEMYHHLADKNVGVSMKPKPFAVGVRIEHSRRYIDKLQYGGFASDDTLGAAKYRLSHEDSNSKRGTYSFCMCPGGYILSSTTEADALVVNGMSNYARNSPWSNSGVITAVRVEDFPKLSSSPKGESEEDVLAGLKFQRSIEQKAYQYSKEKASGKEIPACSLKDFLDGGKGRIEAKNLPTSTCPSGIFRQNLNDIFPQFVTDHLRNAFLAFEKKLKGFSMGEALLLAPETRTSAPVTILRDEESYESISHKGLYPCGEGAGYAGGITSAAVDGVKIADSILLNTGE